MKNGEVISLQSLRLQAAKSEARISKSETISNARNANVPNIISFGQSLRTDILAEADRQCRLCSTMLVIGSTLIVQPAARLPDIAKRNGAFLAIINLSETPCDDICDVLISEKAGVAVQAIVDKIKEIV